MIIDFYNRGGGGDMSDYYTKEDINALIADFVTASTDDLVNYYLKSETYTQAEIEALVGQITSFEVVATLPVSDIKTNVIYLLGPIGTGADRYEEYIYSNNAWVKIGETSIDLSNYVTVTQLNTALGFYTTTQQLNTMLQGKQDTLTAGERISISTQNVISADSQVISLTQAEYDALGTQVDPDVVYVITDATPVTLATVATTGSYNDLTDKPDIPVVPRLATVATTGAYADLTDTPSLATVATSGSYNDLTDKPVIPVVPTLATVATSGSYNDLTNKLAPGTGISIGTDNVISVSGSQTWYGTQQEFEALGTNLDPGTDYYISGDIDYSEIANTPTLATVATTGDYDDLTNKPTIPVVPTLATVATSGSYNDLTDKPTIPAGGDGKPYVELSELSQQELADLYTDMISNVNTYAIGTAVYHDGQPVNFCTDGPYTTDEDGRLIEDETLEETTILFQRDTTANMDGDNTTWTHYTLLSSDGSITDAYTEVEAGGTAVAGTNDGTNWTSITIGTETYDIPAVPTLSTVATSGSYNDLTNKPSIPTVGTGVVTLTQGGATIGTFGLNDSSDKTIDIQAGGDSDVVRLTQAEYDALGTQVDPDTIYVITDASPVTLAAVATTGSYNDLTGKPDVRPVLDLSTLETGQTGAGTVYDLVENWATSYQGKYDFYWGDSKATKINQETQIRVAFYFDVTNNNTSVTTTKRTATMISNGSWSTGTFTLTIPTLATVATTGDYADLTGAPTLATVATSGSYNDLTDKPAIPVVPTLATVATSGSYNDLTDKPAIPVVPTLATVATSGAYSDLSGTPNLSTVATTGAYGDLTGTPALGTTDLVFTLEDSSVVTYTVYISTISQQ